MTGIIIFIFGLAIGSFLNVVIIRLGQSKSFVFGRSACPYCKKEIFWQDNIPLVSFLLLGGKCRHCRKNISLQYPLVELATALVFVLLYLKTGLNIQFAALAIFCCFLMIIFVYDLKHYLILDKIIIPALAVAFLFNLYLGLDFWSMIIGALIGLWFFAFQFIISKGKWVGDGDIRLGTLMGLMLGWQLLLVALFLAYMIGAIVGLILLAANKKKMSSAVPFGPFLSLGTFVTFLWGQELLNWYLNLVYF